MKGELYRMCMLTFAAKSALFGGWDFECAPIAFENKIEFLFLENIKRCGVKDRAA